MPERKGNYTIQLSNRPMILSSADGRWISA